MLKQAMAAAKPQAPQSMASPEAVKAQAGQGDEQATPEEQQAYEGAVNAASVLIYQDENSHAQLLNMMQQQAEEPESAIVNAVKMVVLEVDRQLDLPEIVIAEFSAQVTDMIMELGIEAGLFELDEAKERDVLALSTMAILSEYGAEPEDIQELLGSMNPQQVAELQGAAQSLGGM